MESIVIIGAGIAGLSAGIYARRSGYDVTIYESHFLPGGMCTAWKREGFMFEGCLSFIGLVGSSPAHTWHRLWKQLGVVPSTRMIHHDLFHTFQDESGRTLNIYADADRLEKELLTLSPADAKEIGAMCSTIRRYTGFVRAAEGNPFRFIANAANILRAIPRLRKYGRMNMAEYAARFKDPLIRFALSNLFIYPDFSCIGVFFFLAGMHIRGAGYPQGSSLAFARAIERTFLDSGGRIEYRKRVKRVLEEDGRATGIELEDGRAVKADIVVSAADGRQTLFEMLGDRYTTPALRRRYDTFPLFKPFIQVSLGLNCNLSGTPHAVKVRTAEPFTIAGQSQQALWYHHYAFDPTLAPPGKTSLTVLYSSDFDWWDRLGYGSEAYLEEKARILETTVTQLERLFPGISNRIDATDVATPYTTFRYTHSWKGAIGFLMTKEVAAAMYAKPQYSLPGLRNFYMTGQWVKAFGVPLAAMSGKEVIQAICRAHHRRFKAE